MNNKSIVDNILNNYSSNSKIEQNIRNNISLSLLSKDIFLDFLFL